MKSFHLAAATCGVSALALIAMLPQAALAQEAGASNGFSAPEIVVTAQKISQNVNDVGLSINVLSGQQLNNLGISSPDDLTKAVPGFTYSRSAYGTPIYTLRGIGFYDVVAAAPPAVSTYVDEVPLPYSAMSKGATLDVQRVEVLKGPQGTLFGQNATGGAINFIANKPTKDFAAGATLGYSSYNQVEADGYISGPLAPDLGARIAVSAVRGGDWQKSLTRDDTRGAERFYNGRVLLEWTPSDSLTLLLNANGWIDRGDEQASQIVGLSAAARARPALVNAFNQYPHPPQGARGADWDPGVPFGSNDPVSGHPHRGFKRDNHFYQFALRGDYELSDSLTLTSITSYGSLHIDSFTDTDGMNVATYNAANVATIDTFSQEVRLSGKTDRLQWLIGGNYQHDDVDHAGSTYNQVGTFPFPSAGSIAFMKVKSASAFANVDYEVVPTLHVVAGIRYSDVRIRNRGCTVDGGDGRFAAFQMARNAAPGVVLLPGDCITLDPVTRQPTGLLAARLNENNVPFKLGLNWEVVPDSLLYVSASRGYKAGTFSPVGAIFSPALAPAKQESVMAYEAGFKLGLADRRVQLNGAVFLYNYDDKQVRGRIVDPVLGGLNMTINVPKSRVKGAEAQATWTPDRNWNFNVNAGYTDAKVRGSYVQFTQGGVFANLDGTPLPLTPKWQVSADAGYDAPVSESLGLFAGAHLHHQGSAFSGLGGETQFKTNAYTNIDIRFGIRDADDKWRLSLYAENLFNKYSWNYVSTAGPDAIARLANKPRIMGFRFSVKH